MLNLNAALLDNATLHAPVLGLTLDSAVDHPRAWLEMLELLPCGMANSAECARLQLSAEFGEAEVIASRADITPAIYNSTWVRGTRRFHLAIADTGPLGSVTLEFRVKANADKADVRLQVLAVDQSLLDNPDALACTAMLLGGFFATVSKEIVSVYHSALSPDLADTAVNLALVAPNAEFQEFLDTAVSVLRAEFMKHCNVEAAYAPTVEGLFADAITHLRAPASAPRVTLDAEQRLALAVNLCMLREAKGLTQLDVAFQALGFAKSHAAVSRLERGILSEVETERLDKLARFFETSREVLLENRVVSGEPNRPGEGEGPALFHSDRDFTPAPHFGSRITLARTSVGLSVAGLAAKMGHVSGTTVQQWESEGATPRKDSFIDIAMALETPVSWLMYGKRIGAPDRALALRLTAMQKLYNLSNTEVAALMNPTNDAGELDDERGRVHRLSVARHGVPPTVLRALAKALQVPPEWISPPSAEALQEDSRLNGLTSDAGVTLGRTTKKLIGDIVELAELGVLSDEAIRELRGYVAEKYMAPYIRGARKTASA